MMQTIKQNQYAPQGKGSVYIERTEQYLCSIPPMSENMLIPQRLNQYQY